MTISSGWAYTPQIASGALNRWCICEGTGRLSQVIHCGGYGGSGGDAAVAKKIGGHCRTVMGTVLR